jgi:hypothetical protein
MSLFALGNVEWSQGEDLIRKGARLDGEKKLQQSYETHQQSLRLYTRVLGLTHYKTAQALYKVACHEHHKRFYAQSK